VFSIHPSCYHLQSEQVEIDGMDMMESTDKMEEYNHPTNHRLREECMNMVKEYYHPINHRLEVEDIDMVGTHMMDMVDMMKEHLWNH
jgi:hypothetical protein